MEVFDQTNETVIVDNVGTYNESNGSIKLNGFGTTLTAITGGSIKISAVPANQETIKPLRNYIFNVDNTKNIAIGTIDRQNTETTLTV